MEYSLSLYTDTGKHMQSYTLSSLPHHAPGGYAVPLTGGSSGAYLQEGITLDIIALMHQPAPVAGDGLPQVLHGAACNKAAGQATWEVQGS